jgi:hypothetical protein
MTTDMADVTIWFKTEKKNNDKTERQSAIEHESEPAQAGNGVLIFQVLGFQVNKIERLIKTIINHEYFLLRSHIEEKVMYLDAQSINPPTKQ